MSMFVHTRNKGPEVMILRPTIAPPPHTPTPHMAAQLGSGQGQFIQHVTKQFKLANTIGSDSGVSLYRT